MYLYFGLENDSFLFVKGFLIVDVFEKMSFEYVFFGSAVFSLDINLTKPFTLVLKVIKMCFTSFIIK